MQRYKTISSAPKFYLSAIISFQYCLSPQYILDIIDRSPSFFDLIFDG